MFIRPCRTAQRARWGRAALVAALGATSLLAACGTGSPTGAARDGTLQVVASFYPLEYVAQRVGGPDVEVTSLTRPGAEPHDLELTPRDVAAVQRADLVVYLSGFQPSVDQAVENHRHGDGVVDVAGAAHLDLRAVPEAGHVEDEHADEAGGGALDPHFWLDPTRLAAVAEQVASAMADADPSAADAFHRRAHALNDDLANLDRDYRQRLEHCASRDLVTSHTAFGYLAQRYDLHQVGITGLTPEAEPDPRSLAQVATFVRAHHVATIYSETLVSPAVARTVAQETGATTALLDPLEGLTDASKGRDYLQVMRSNLDTLAKGQGCS